MSNFYEQLCALCGGASVKTDEPMKKYTTFRVGGPAKYLVSPRSVECLKELILLCGREEIPYYILGNGSNLLVSDEGYDGVMILLGEAFSYVEAGTEQAGGAAQRGPDEQAGAAAQSGTVLTAGAGTLLSRIAREALTRGLTGFEFAAGIPGTLGGAAVMNAGAYGGEMKDVLHSVRVLTRQGGIRDVPAGELELGYRTSRVLRENWIVLSARIGLTAGEHDVIRGRMDDLAGRRREKQPLEYPSAGSTFKRPVGYFAGKLIEDAGLRGFRVGDAQVSEKHCGFVINRGQATAAEIRELIRQVQSRVKAESGVDLETEVKLIGWRE